MPPHLLSSRNAPPSRSDFLLKELLTEMTRQPTPNLPKPWVLQYIPPKHLRLPGYVYRSVEDTADIDLRNMVEATAMRRIQAESNQQGCARTGLASTASYNSFDRLVDNVRS
mmetsp:Transcript_26385/g.44187  ORF Transcript_26385/g.44187 Transcript_26385/m.44187 type:complete len:112 (-) Transcript_26385:609-944(-)